MGFAGNGVASLSQRRPNGTDFIFDVKGPFHPGRPFSFVCARQGAWRVSAIQSAAKNTFYLGVYHEVT